MRTVLSLFLSTLLWAASCAYAQTDEVPYQINEQATAQAPWKPGSIVAQTTNGTPEEPLIYRKFLGITDQGYYVVQDFYKGSNHKQTEPFVIMQLSEVTVFKSNTPSIQGIYVQWYDNGQKWVYGQYQDGKEQGLWTWWYDNGRKESEGQFQNGKPQGLWTYWDKEGKKISETMYEAGKVVSCKPLL